MGLVKTRRLAAMHPPSPRLRWTGKQQRAKARMKSHPPKVTRPLAPSTRYHRIYINPVVTPLAEFRGQAL